MARKRAGVPEPVEDAEQPVAGEVHLGHHLPGEVGPVAEEEELLGEAPVGLGQAHLGDVEQRLEQLARIQADLGSTSF